MARNVIQVGYFKLQYYWLFLNRIFLYRTSYAVLFQSKRGQILFQMPIFFLGNKTFLSIGGDKYNTMIMYTLVYL